VGEPGLHVDLRTSLGDGAPFTLEVAFDVPPGVTVLFGPSGAGKSRTLACICGIARPDAGRITEGGEPWFDAAAKIDVPIHARRAALVFQSLALFPHMTALENVMFGVPGGGSGAERSAAALGALERMRVAAVAGRRPRSLSGGEAQRVALARAFASKPRALLLDEPFSALDAGLKDALLAETRAYVEDARIPTVLVTHDVAEAEALGDHVLFLERGRITRRSLVSGAFP
jgi:molybdate transport system ATP-binding protein